MSLNLSCYHALKLTADLKQHDTNHWIVLNLIEDGGGKTLEFTLFFDDPVVCKGYADAINGVKVAPVVQAEAA